MTRDNCQISKHGLGEKRRITKGGIVQGKQLAAVRLFVVLSIVNCSPWSLGPCGLPDMVRLLINTHQQWIKPKSDALMQRVSIGFCAFKDSGKRRLDWPIYAPCGWRTL